MSQIPYVIFALRQLPNRSLGFSPNELVLGHSAHTSLDALVDGWIKPSDSHFDVGSWVDELRELLDSLRDIAAFNAAEESSQRKRLYDCVIVLISFSISDKVLHRIPGRTHKLAASWEGPFFILDKLGPVTYRIKEVKV